MSGFFNIDQLQTDSFNSKGKPATCVSCGLYKNANSPKIKEYGEFKKEILLINEFPSIQDDKIGVPWQGRSGRQVKNIFTKNGIDIKKDCLTIHAINCRTEKANIKAQHIEACRAKVMQVIRKKKPKLIILFGTHSLNSIVGKFWKKNLGSINKWRGFLIPDQDLKTWLAPVYSINFVNTYDEKSKTGLAELIFKQDIKNALECIKKPFPDVKDDKDNIVYINTVNDLKRAIKDILRYNLFSFDYEATGLKPYADGQKLICTSICTPDLKSYVFANTPEFDKYLGVLLKNKIGKTAHNLQFEDMWSTEKIGCVTNWKWCSMNASHILDNRPGISGLKFQVYVNFGVSDYDSDINPYLKSDTKKYGNNGINRIEEYIKKYGIKPVLTYCGLDSLYGMKLTLLQIKKINLLKKGK